MTSSRVTTAALTAAALVVIAACGAAGSGGTAENSAAKAPHASSAPARAPITPPATVSAPAITFPAGARTLYENRRTGDRRKDQVLADEAHANDATYAAILEGTNRTPAMEFYHSGTALRDAADFVQNWLDKGATWVGTIRYFDRTVTLKSDGSAVVTYCSDETKAFVKTRATGHIEHDRASADDYVQYNERLKESPRGVWIIVNILSLRGAKTCQP